MRLCSPFVTCAIWFIVAALISACASRGTALDKFELTVSVENEITIQVEVFMPNGGKPRALVVTVPGTDGMGDPYLLRELAQSEYNPDRRGGLTDALLARNYAVAFFSQRGYAAAKSCVAGKNYEQRLQSYADKCVNVGIRAQVSLHTITSDTQKVFSALAKHPRLTQHPQIALALSEGFYHVAQLVKEKTLRPSAIVSVGGPLESLADVLEYQDNRKYYLQKIEAAFSNCKATTMQVEELFKCTKILRSVEKSNALREIFGGDSISINDLAAKKTFFENVTKNYFEAYSKLPKNAILSRSTDGRILGIWSARFYSDFFAETQPVAEKLFDFNGGLALLYGAEDHRVLVPKAGQCATSIRAKNSKSICEVIVLPGLGHGLEDETGDQPKSALKALVAAIENVTPPR
jgi:pimeloyl-ACP methyl ester carboxylesterase